MDPIYVRVLATGEITQIPESDFDVELHARVSVEDQSEASPVEELRDMFVAAQAENRTAIAEGMATALREAGLGRPTAAPAIVPALPGEGRLTGSFATPAWEGQYRSLPEWEREYRTPKSDELVARWACALINKDRAGADRIALEDDATRALSQGTATAGGNIVPSPLAGLIVEKARKLQAIGPRALQLDDPAGKADVPVESTLMTAAQVAENSPASESDPAWTQVNMVTQSSVSATRSSKRLVTHSPFSITSLISRQAGRAIALNNDTQDATAGNGTPPNQTDALDNNGSITEIDAAVATLVYADVSDMYYTLLAEYRQGAVWLARSEVIQTLAGLLDLNGRQIFVPATAPASPLTGGQEGGAPGVGTMLGLPVIEAPMGAGVLFISNLELGYAVLTETGAPLRVEVSDEAEDVFLKDQVIWKFVQMRDGAVTQTDAHKKIGGITEI